MSDDIIAEYATFLLPALRQLQNAHQLSDQVFAEIEAIARAAFSSGYELAKMRDLQSNMEHEHHTHALEEGNEPKKSERPDPGYV